MNIRKQKRKEDEELNKKKKRDVYFATLMLRGSSYE